MSRPRPINFLLLCLGLLLVQLIILAFHGSRLWWQGAAWARAVLVIGVIAGVVHLALLLVQLPQALRWRPRRSVRPSAELRAAHRRLARELHDRVGSRLVNAMALMDRRWLESAPHRAALEQVLLELRLLVDTMDAPDRTPQEQLSQLRSRVQPVFARQGIDLQWELDAHELPDTRQEALLVLVAQEGLSNVLQHASASRACVTLRSVSDGSAWELKISDDGHSLAQAGGEMIEWPGGLGMKSMRERVREAGGQLTIEPSSLGGLCLRAIVKRHAEGTGASRGMG